MCAVILSKQEQLERKQAFFCRACKMFSLEPDYVSRSLLELVPEQWPDAFGGGVTGGRAASILATTFAKVLCAEGKHNAEHELCLAAATRVTTDEAPSYRDAWYSTLTAMEHCYRELPTEARAAYAQEMLLAAQEAVADTDRRFAVPGRESPSHLGQMDLLVSKLSDAQSLAGVPETDEVRDYRRRKRNQQIRKRIGPSRPFFQKHSMEILRTWDENRVSWFAKKYREKYDREPPNDLFVPSEYTRAGIQMKIGYSSLFDRNDHKLFRVEMEALYREKAGLPAKGEGWVTQTLLSRCVEQVLADREVLREASPSWLNGQRLDIYVPSLKLALEYQGEQHYFPLEHWGGDQGLSDRRLMDEKKRKSCQKKGITLIEWRYDEPVSAEALMAKLTVHAIDIQ